MYLPPLQTRNLADEQRDLAETTQSSADNLMLILNDILDFSRIETGSMNLKHETFDLRASLEELRPDVEKRAREKGLEFTHSIAPEIPGPQQGDPDRLRQVLNSLIDNAIKFTSEGKVALRVSLQEEEESHTLVRFVVEDTGIGIPESKLDKLYEAFWQADTSSTRRYGGTGLGLAIAKRLVRMMGGALSVDSEEGVGASFSFTIRFKKQIDS